MSGGHEHCKYPAFGVALQGTDSENRSVAAGVGRKTLFVTRKLFNFVVPSCERVSQDGVVWKEGRLQILVRAGLVWRSSESEITPLSLPVMGHVAAGGCPPRSHPGLTSVGDPAYGPRGAPSSCTP